MVEHHVAMRMWAFSLVGISKDQKRAAQQGDAEMFGCRHLVGAQTETSSVLSSSRMPKVPDSLKEATLIQVSEQRRF